VRGVGHGSADLVRLRAAKLVDDRGDGHSSAFATHPSRTLSDPSDDAEERLAERLAAKSAEEEPIKGLPQSKPTEAQDVLGVASVTATTTGPGYPESR